MARILIDAPERSRSRSAVQEEVRCQKYVKKSPNPRPGSSFARGKPPRRWPPSRRISRSRILRQNRHLLGFDNPRKALLTTVRSRR